MSDSMVERVARAICCQRIGYNCQLGLGGYGGSGADARCGCGYTDDMRKYARAAIAAMREPTPKMVDEGAIFCCDDCARGGWRTMIDEALK